MKNSPFLSRKLPLGFLALLLLMLPAMRPAEKYLGSWLWWIPYALISFGLIYSVVADPRGLVARALSSRWFIFGTPVLLAVISTIFYPFADALKFEMQGQDQDDCTILGVNALLSGEHPFDTPSYFGNPCSPMVGALIPFVPFVVTNLVGLAGPVFFGISVLVLYYSKVDRLHLGGFVAIMAGTPATLELMVNGSDFVFIGSMALVAVILLARSHNPSFFRTPQMVKLAVLVGLIASARISMPIFAVPFGMVLLQRRNRWLAFTALTSSIIVIPNLWIYLSSPEDFSPLHLVAKGQSLVPGAFYVLMFATTAVAIAFGALQWKRGKMDEMSLTITVFAPHLIFLAFGDLVFNRQFDIFWWEGANYLYLVTPLLAWFAVQKLLPSGPRT
jgi:hypothetical protein